MLLVLQIVGPLVGHFDIIETLHLVGNRPLNHTRDIRKQTDNADFHAALAHYGIRLYVFAENKFREIIVGADYRAFEIAQTACEFLDTVVELVISERHHIIFHRIDKINLDIASEFREI